jgi:hypothetical protein
MSRALFNAGCMALIVLFGMGALPLKAFSQTGIVVNPENPSEIDSLEIMINAESITSPVWINSTIVEVTEGLIKIIADVSCGPFYMITPYTINVVVPPVVAGTYDIQYWTTEDCHLGSNPILSSEIVVSPVPIATGRTTWGAIKALWQ